MVVPLMLKVNGTFSKLQFLGQYVLKSNPFMRAWGSRGSNFSAPAKRHTSGNRAVQLPAPGRPTALLSVYLLSYELQCAGLRCAQAVAPRIKITPPFAPSNGLYNCYETVAPVTRTSMCLSLITGKNTFYAYVS